MTYVHQLLPSALAGPEAASPAAAQLSAVSRSPMGAVGATCGTGNGEQM